MEDRHTDLSGSRQKNHPDRTDDRDALQKAETDATGSQPAYKQDMTETELTFILHILFYPESVIRLHPYFVLLSFRLVLAFIEDVANYIEKKRETR